MLSQAALDVMAEEARKRWDNGYMPDGYRLVIVYKDAVMVMEMSDDGQRSMEVNLTEISPENLAIRTDTEAKMLQGEGE